MINKSIVKQVQFKSNNWGNGWVNGGEILKLIHYGDRMNEWENDLNRPAVSLSEQMQEGISPIRMLLMMYSTLAPSIRHEEREERREGRWFCLLKKEEKS